MFRFLIRASWILFGLALALFLWAWLWPKVTDERTRIAPVMEKVLPLTGATARWREVFAPDSKRYDDGFARMESELDDEPDGIGSDSDLDALFGAIHSLASDLDWDVPLKTGQNRGRLTDLSRFRTLVRYGVLLRNRGSEELSESVAVLSLAYLERAKSLVDYLAALSAVRSLHESGVGMEGFVDVWRPALGRALLSEYYLLEALVEQEGLSSGFLFQERKTLNDYWRYLDASRESVQNGNERRIGELTDAIVSANRRWPHTNFRGEILHALLTPALPSLYQNSLDLEKAIRAGLSESPPNK